MAVPTIRKMTGTIGAEIIGIPMDGNADSVDSIRQAVLTHHVVAVRGQFISPEALLAFGAKLGDFMMTRGVVANHRLPNLLVLTNPGKGAAISAENWHTDGTTSERPPSFTLLAADTLPEAGGDTLFVDMGHAYRTLSPRYQRFLRGLRGRHVNRLLAAEKRLEAWHPLVRTIPETGERVLFPGFPNIMQEIEAMTLAESRSILDFLFSHSTKYDAMYRHRWLPGDVLIWDNRSTMHYAVHDYGDAPRTHVRLMIQGERPSDAPYPDDET
jgi:taurine dioxygenase